LLRAVVDLHNLRAAAVFQRDAVSKFRGQQCFAERRNPTRRIRREVEFIHTNKRVRVCLPLSSFTVALAPNATLFDGASGGSTIWTDPRMRSSP
jgi:hypothetical protein